MATFPTKCRDAEHWASLRGQVLAVPRPCMGRTALMYSDDPADIERARGLCAGCPVIIECRLIAIAGREADGVWGGMTPQERRAWARQVLAPADT